MYAGGSRAVRGGDPVVRGREAVEVTVRVEHRETGAPGGSVSDAAPKRDSMRVGSRIADLRPVADRGIVRYREVERSAPRSPPRGRKTYRDSGSERFGVRKAQP